MSSVLVSPERLEASVCQDSLLDFFQRFWGTAVAEPLLKNWHIEYLCRIIQQVAERVLHKQHTQGDLVINISPGTTKSTICSVMLPAWLWTRDPTIRIICGSYSSPLSLHLASLTRNVVTSDKYRKLFPAVELVEEQKGLMTTTKGGQRISTSVGGSITGMHGHMIVVDDPIDPRGAVSQVQLATANDWIDRTLSTRKIDRNVTPLLLIMQRLHEADPTGHLLSKQGKRKHVCLPAEFDDNIKPASLARYYRKGLMDPKRLPAATLEQARNEMGDFSYAGQFQQRPVPLEGAMFRPGRIDVQRAAPVMMQTIRYWDKAGTRDSGAYTAGVKMGQDRDGRIWILDVVRGRWDAWEREHTIQQTAAMDGHGVVIAIEQEPGSGGKESAEASVRKLQGYRVRLDRPVGDKILRADPFATQVNGGNVCIVRADWNRPYLEELTHFPQSRYKDQVDASSGAYAVLTQRRSKVGAFR